MPLILDTPRSLSPSSSYTRTRQQDQHESEILIVGAGILGTSLAVTLARQGRSVTLLERSLKQPDRIVGELLQPGGVAALEKLGLRDCLEDIDAIRVLGYEIIFHGEQVRVSYPENIVEPGEADRGTQRGGEDGAHPGASKEEDKRVKKSRPEGRSFHHGRFIQRLREAAMKEPNIMLVESTATGLVKDDYSNQVLGVECTTKGAPDYYFAHLTIVSDGYASKFRSTESSTAVRSASKFYALELIDVPLPSPNHGHTILSPTCAPTLLYQIGTHETRALMDVPTNCPTASVAAGGVKAHLQNVVLPSLPKNVQPAFATALAEGKLKSMPNSFLPPKTNVTPGFCILGDALNMRHPLTGGGMTVAFKDVVLLRDLLSPTTLPNLADTKEVLERFKTFHWKRKTRGSSTINILAMALYALFAADGTSLLPLCPPTLAAALTPTDPQLQALQNGCFRYFQLGGNCIDGPVSLLGGLIAQPFVLFYHFFAVALYSIWLYVMQIGSQVSAPVRLAMIPVRLVMSVSVFWKACGVLLPYIWSEMRS